MQLDTTKVANEYMRSLERNLSEALNEKNLLAAQLTVAAQEYAELLNELNTWKSTLNTTSENANEEMDCPTPTSCDEVGCLGSCY